MMFLSTPPSRVATKQPCKPFSVLLVFLSTPPSRVATKRSLHTILISMRFYPRHPRGWRRQPGRRANHPNHRRFYPRHPRGWRQTLCRGLRHLGGVSIHATLAGGDQICCKSLPSTHAFLSTPPSRVATRRQKPIMNILSSFYPRHPRGWRL